MYITNEIQVNFRNYLIENEKSERTIEKYTKDIQRLSNFVGKQELTKAIVLQFKEQLRKEMQPVSANSIIAAVNTFLKFLDLPQFCIKAFKVQRNLFSMKNELSEGEYKRLVKTALTLGKVRLALIIQTICATGIRISELKYITVEAVKNGRSEVFCKGKFRTIIIPQKLKEIILQYINKKMITSGSVFVTRGGKYVNRSNIWSDMKKLCKAANVAPEKVFPHNLRHLFARAFYALEKDIVRLSDILGHSSVATTRIYTIDSGREHIRQVNLMDLVISEASVITEKSSLHNIN